MASISASSQQNQKKKSNLITIAIVVCLIVGVAAGWLLNARLEPAAAKSAASSIGVITTMFLHLIKMVIAPLVFSTLVVGIAQMGDGKTIGRVGGKAMLWFITASVISLTLGLIIANLTQPGAGLSMAIPDVGTKTGLPTSAFSASAFFIHLIPTSLFDALAKNDILQIVVFSVLFGVCLAGLGDIAKPILRALDVLMHVMLKLTGMVMWTAPLAVFAAMASTITEKGPTVIINLAWFMGAFAIGMLVLWAVLVLVGWFILGNRVFKLLAEVKEAFLLAFATASSEAAFPKILTALERFGVKNRISSFVLPLGYSFNLDGSMMYCTFATLFVAQAYNLHIDFGTQVTMMLVLMLTSKGMAGVPRASLVVIAANLNHFNIPEAGLVLVLGVDPFLDMARSATNAIGNSLAAAAVAKWEGDLLTEEEAAQHVAMLDAGKADDIDLVGAVPAGAGR